MVKMKVVEGVKIMIEKADKEVWKNCTDFLTADFENIAIGAPFLLECCDVWLTENKDHFERLPNLKGKVMTPKEFNQKS